MCASNHRANHTTPTPLRPFDVIRERLQNVQENGHGCVARCPAHDDRHNSLSVREGDDGRVLLKCFAGCDYRDVVAALDLQPCDLYPSDGRSVRPTNCNRARRRIIATYDYHAADDTLLYQTVRYEPKDFRQRRPNGNGGWTWDLEGVQRVLYRLPALLVADPAAPVYVCAGEKDADALHGLGLVATTNVGGEGRGKWLAQYNDWLRQRHVVVLEDNDPTGRHHAQAVARALYPGAASVKILALPGLPAKGDVSDWLAAGGTRAALASLVELTPVWTAPKAATHAEDCQSTANGSLGDGWQPWRGVLLHDVQLERLNWLSRGRLAHGKITLLEGDPGLGKSTMLADWIARVTTGAALPDGEAVAPAGVVLLSAEDGLGDTIRPRLEAAGADLSRVLALTGIPEEDTDRLPAIPDDLLPIEDAVRHVGAVLLVIDPVMAYLGNTVNAYRDHDVRRALAPLAALAERTGVAVVLVRHLTKTMGGSPLYRGNGSIAFMATARFGLLVAADPDNPEQRVLATSKCNLARSPATLAYRLDGVPGTDVARVVWLGE